MVAKSPLESELERALLVDEIGIVSAVIGPHRLKTTHQPMFRRDGAVLVPFGAEARIVAERDGASETAAAFFDQVPLPQRGFAEAVCRKLNLNNFHHIGIDDPHGFDCYLTIDPRLEASEEAMAEIAAVPRLLDTLEVPATSLIVEILDANFLSLDILLGLAGRLRDAGVRIAVAEFRTGQPTVDRLTLLRPDVIKIDGNWFRSAQDSAATTRLLPAVLNAFTGLGAKLLVQGIETIRELDAALGCEADYLQGRALAGPAPAGSIIDPGPRDLDELLRPLRKVVSLRRRHSKR